TTAEDETFVPVYYTVKGKEGLYRVALNHNDLPLETLKQWNNIKGDAVKNGTRLIVGYLKVKKELSELAGNGIGNSIGSTTVTIKNDEKKTAPSESVPSPVQKKEVSKPAVKPAAETVAAEPKKNSTIRNTVGPFKNQYETQVKNSETVEASGTAGVFKSNSGWTDKKYYCLHNSALQGTIIKITNPANGKFVFAKVLDLMPDINQNEGLLIAISNAAADELGAVPGNFNCSINYSK
ncbi:MAG: LysM peptidoglycan-binding domain-containing protein, partial [Ferruginibacter sp.]